MMAEKQVPLLKCCPRRFTLLPAPLEAAETIVKTKYFYKISRSFPIHAKYRCKNTRAPTDTIFICHGSHADTRFICLHRDAEIFLQVFNQ
jgi:hypothetical protein